MSSINDLICTKIINIGFVREFPITVSSEDIKSSDRVVLQFGDPSAIASDFVVETFDGKMTIHGKLYRHTYINAHIFNRPNFYDIRDYYKEIDIPINMDEVYVEIPFENYMVI